MKRHDFLNFASLQIAGRRSQLFFAWFICLTFYCFAWFLSRRVVADISPLWATAGRLISCLAIILVINTIYRPKKIENLKDLISTLGLLSILGFSLYFTATFFALKTITSVDLVIMLSLIPCATYVGTLVQKTQSYDRRKVIGLFLATVAVIAYQFHARSDKSKIDLQGMGTALIAVVSYAGYGLLYAKKMQTTSVLSALPILLFMALAIVIPLALTIDGVPHSASALSVLNVFLIGALFSAPVYLLYNTLLKAGYAFFASLIGILGPFGVGTLEIFSGSRDHFSPTEVVLLLTCALGLLMCTYPHKPTSEK
jgi:drug/metabolite transporter (DMT)-like permease